MRKNHPIIAVGIAAALLLLPIAIFYWPTTSHPVANRNDDRLEQLERRIDGLAAAIEKLTAQQASNSPPSKPSVRANNEQSVTKSKTDRSPPVQSLGSLGPAPLAVASSATGLGGLAIAAERAKDAALTQDVSKIEHRGDASTASVEASDPAGKQLEVDASIQANREGPPRNKAEDNSADKHAPNQATKNAMAKQSNGKSGVGDLGQGELGAVLGALNPKQPKPPRKPDFEAAVMRPAGPRVRQSENVVIATKQPGWPVVVVRSEIDGDRWWVQQLVTRQGAYIASQTKFGNEQTVPGIKFEMVLLLLDTAEESVRFRTARQFEELPSGIRRSQSFQFTRH